jgi:hypothetical protein
MTSATFVVRVWLPDRPGALGAVASRIGAVKGDVVSIEILERGGGRAIDEIVLQLPSADLLNALVREINEVDGVDVEEIRPVIAGTLDPFSDALEVAAKLVGAGTAEELLDALCDHAYRGIGASWAVVVSLDGCEVRAERGTTPSPAWLAAFLEGSQATARLATGFSPSDLTWVPLPSAGVALVLGREGTAFRAKERRQAAALARIADAWLCGLRSISVLSSRLAHPSRVLPPA